MKRFKEFYEDIQRRADVKMVKTHGPDGRVVMKKQKAEIKVESVENISVKKEGQDD